jgi:triphosphatase
MFDTVPTPAAERAARLLLRPMRATLHAARTRLMDESTPEGPHALRVSLRRLRAALWLAKPAVDPATFDALTASARSLMAACGRVRQLDVLLNDTLPRLDAAGDGATLGPRRMAAFARAAAPVRARFLAEARAEAEGPAWAALDATLGAWLDAEEGRFADRHDLAALAGIAAKRLQKRDRRLRKALRALDTLDLPARHALRLDVKRLRYAVEAAATLFDGADPRSYIDAATRLQGLLGAANDAAEALATLRATAAESGEPQRHAPLIAAAERALAAPGGKRTAAQIDKATRRLRKAGRVWRTDGDHGG